MTKIHAKKIEKQKNGIVVHTLENNTIVYDASKIKFIVYHFSFGHTNEKIIEKLREKIDEILDWAKSNNIIMDNELQFGEKDKIEQKETLETEKEEKPKIQNVTRKVKTTKKKTKVKK